MADSVMQMASIYDALARGLMVMLFCASSLALGSSAIAAIKFMKGN